MVEQDPRVLRDYALPRASDITSSIFDLAVKANNFELRLALVPFVEKDQLGGCPTENPHVHLCNFLAKCGTIKLNGVFADAIKLRLFPFSLKDQACDWLQNEKSDSFTTWEALSKKFLIKYFSLDKTAKLRVDITLVFSTRRWVPIWSMRMVQGPLTQWPHHGVPGWL